MSNKAPPLIVSAKAVSKSFDAATVATELGFASVPDGAATLLWLTATVHAAGLGLPADPLRTRGWSRFGRPLASDEEPAAGDVVIALVSGEEVAGLLVSTDRTLQIKTGPEELLRAAKTKLVIARRPITPAPSEI